MFSFGKSCGLWLLLSCWHIDRVPLQRKNPCPLGNNVYSPFSLNVHHFRLKRLQPNALQFKSDVDLQQAVGRLCQDKQSCPHSHWHLTMAERLQHPKILSEEDYQHGFNMIKHQLYWIRYNCMILQQAGLQFPQIFKTPETTPNFSSAHWLDVLEDTTAKAYNYLNHVE